MFWIFRFLKCIAGTVSDSCPLPSDKEMTVDPFLNGSAVLIPDIHQKDQELSLSIPVHHITAPDRLPDCLQQPCGQFFQLPSVSHRNAFAVHHRAKHQAYGLSASPGKPVAHSVEPLKHRIAALIRSLPYPGFIQVFLDFIQRIIRMDRT